MKISLGSWAFSFGPYESHPIPFDRAARRLAEAGYDGVEVSGFPPHVSLDRYPTAAPRRELRVFLQDLGLECSGYAADLTSVNPAAPGNKQKYLDLFQRNLELCRDLRIPAIRVDSVAAPDSISDAEYLAARDRLVETWRDAADLGQAAGVRVVWEFEPAFAFNKPSEIRAIADAVNHANFGILFDTSHAYTSAVMGARHQGAREVLPGGIPEMLQLLDRRIRHIHLIDSDGSLYNNETSTHVPFGAGKIDFASLAPQLLKIPDIGWWCIDMCFWEGAWSLVDTAHQYVKNLLAAAN
jgi:sugar phosphate isomerase/epimerase